MEKNLELTLAWLGLSQYYERFLQAGFDCWETLLEITESDLEVKSMIASIPGCPFNCSLRVCIPGMSMFTHNLPCS